MPRRLLTHFLHSVPRLAINGSSLFICFFRRLSSGLLRLPPDRNYAPFCIHATVFPCKTSSPPFLSKRTRSLDATRSTATTSSPTRTRRLPILPMTRTTPPTPPLRNAVHAPFPFHPLLCAPHPPIPLSDHPLFPLLPLPTLSRPSPKTIAPLIQAFSRCLPYPAPPFPPIHPSHPLAQATLRPPCKRSSPSAARTARIWPKRPSSPVKKKSARNSSSAIEADLCPRRTAWSMPRMRARHGLARPHAAPPLIRAVLRVRRCGQN